MASLIVNGMDKFDLSFESISFIYLKVFKYNFPIKMKDNNICIDYPALVKEKYSLWRRIRQEILDFLCM